MKKTKMFNNFTNKINQFKPKMTPNMKNNIVLTTMNEERESQIIDLEDELVGRTFNPNRKTRKNGRNKKSKNQQADKENLLGKRASPVEEAPPSEVEIRVNNVLVENTVAMPNIEDMKNLKPSKKKAKGKSKKSTSRRGRPRLRSTNSETSDISAVSKKAKDKKSTKADKKASKKAESKSKKAKASKSKKSTKKGKSVKSTKNNKKGSKKLKV